MEKEKVGEMRETVSLVRELGRYVTEEDITHKWGLQKWPFQVIGTTDVWAESCR